MKRLMLAVTGLLLFTMLTAQTLDEIVKKYSAANKLDKVSGFSTIKITAKMSMMGMEMPMEMWMKNPNKIKTVASMNGQEVISVFDGEKGYMINPMAGSSIPVEMTPEMKKQTMDNNVFQNSMINYLKAGKLSLEGEEKVNEKPAFKLKANIEGGNTAYMFIDKVSYLLVKTSATVNQGGQTMTADSYPSNYTETNGILLPMKTTTSAGGMEIVLTIEKVEVNIPMDDSVFTLKK
jgi:outer membrane lipoprotein-sorting protein